MSEPIEIPNRPLFKAAEVCELLKVQPYVLRTWEAEFRDLGVSHGTSGARVYRREDVERARRIKHMLLIEGLTLAGVRRKLEEELEPPLEGTLLPVTLGPDARERIVAVKEGLRSLLGMLEAAGPPPHRLRAQVRGDDATEPGEDFSLAPLGLSESHARSERGDSADRERGRSPRRKRST
ncbi:MAG: MerR family transcriptional regulator [Vicinamibacterales bacterium]